MARKSPLNPRPITERAISRSIRTDVFPLQTSMNAGLTTPLGFIPLLREDSAQGNFNLRFDMAELGTPLRNAVKLRVYAYFVPHLACERFKGSMDRLNNSYTGVPEVEGSTPVPYFDIREHEGGFFRYRGMEETVFSVMGKHTGPSINWSPVEAYNTIVQYQRDQVSSKLPKALTELPRITYAVSADHLATQLELQLKPCLWNHTALRGVTDSFDQAMIDGTVQLELLKSQIPVRGIAKRGPSQNSALASGVDASGKTVEYSGFGMLSSGSDNNDFIVDVENMVPQIYAEMSAQGVTLNLQTIEMAKKTRAFALIRKKYEGHDDELISLLMDGIRVPDAALTQPILLDFKETIFGYKQRFSTDADALDISVSDGIAAANLNINLPQQNTGGVIMFLADIVPEQMFERKSDLFLNNLKSVEQLPAATRDSINPQPVEFVSKGQIDLAHSDPDGIFGYRPMNDGWQRHSFNIGGKFARPNPDSLLTEDRFAIWTVEDGDPEYNEDLLLATNLHHDVFADQNADAFEVSGVCAVRITGLTQFAPELHEASDDYDKIVGLSPTKKVVGGGSSVVDSVVDLLGGS